MEYEAKTLNLVPVNNSDLKVVFCHKVSKIIIITSVYSLYDKYSQLFKIFKNVSNWLQDRVSL